MVDRSYLDHDSSDGCSSAVFSSVGTGDLDFGGPPFGGGGSEDAFFGVEDPPSNSRLFASPSAKYSSIPAPGEIPWCARAFFPARGGPGAPLGGPVGIPVGVISSGAPAEGCDWNPF